MDEALKKQKEAEEAAAKQKVIDEATAPIKAELAKAQEDLKKLQDKDFNFSKVVKSDKEKEAMLEDAAAKIKILEGKIIEVANQPVSQAKDRLLKSLAGEDKVLQGKLEYNFNRLGKDAKTEAEVESAMKEAFLLATGSQVKTDAVRGVQGAGGGYNRVAPVGGQMSISPEVKAWAEQFNANIIAMNLPKNMLITDEDLKNPKYAVKPGQSAESTYKLN